MRDCQCTTLLCEAARALPLPLLNDAALCTSALRSRTLQVLHRSAPPSHILPFDAPYCSLQSDDALCVYVRSLEDNRLDEQAEQALRNAWRGAPYQLEL